MNGDRILLDTCAIIYRANGEPIAAPAKNAVHRAALAGGVLISPVSAWEVGLLSRPGRTKYTPFLPTPNAWFARVMSEPGVQEAPFTRDIAIDSSHLPQPFHDDPADCILVATARALNVPLMTRDARILDYGRAGHVTAIAC